MSEFPFPNKENSFKLFERDCEFKKINANEIDGIFQECWDLGKKTADKFIEGFNGCKSIDMINIFESNNYKIKYINEDYVLGNDRYFCENISGKKVLKIYTISVELWCSENGFSYEDGLNIILYHEYYHYLEWYDIGLTSKRYLVPMIKIGKFSFGKTGVPVLSEIAANSFAERCFNYFSDLKINLE